MAVTSDIAAMYWRPAQVVRRLLSREESEPRALAYLMGACGIMFLAQWPAISRRVWLSNPEGWAAEPGSFQAAVQPEIAGALLGAIIFLPLLFYILAAVVQGILRLTGLKVSGYDMRISLFWALLAATPLALLSGLTAGFVGNSPALTLVGVLWFGVVLWFVATGARQAHLLAGETA